MHAREITRLRHVRAVVSIFLARVVLAVRSPLYGYVLLYLVRCAVATVAVCGFGSRSVVFHCGMPRQISPLPPTPSQTAVCSMMGESILLSPFHNPMLEKARRANLPLLAIGCRADCSGERRTSPFNGIERSLGHAVVIKTKSLPISATTFATALSLNIVHDGRNHKHNPTLFANKNVVQICCSSLSAAAMALQTVQVSVEPRLSTAFKDRSVVP